MYVYNSMLLTNERNIRECHSNIQSQMHTSPSWILNIQIPARYPEDILPDIQRNYGNAYSSWTSSLISGELYDLVHKVKMSRPHSHIFDRPTLGQKHNVVSKVWLPVDLQFWRKMHE